jgi:hypothetical protein
MTYWCSCPSDRYHFRSFVVPRKCSRWTVPKTSLICIFTLPTSPHHPHPTLVLKCISPRLQIFCNEQLIKPQYQKSFPPNPKRKNYIFCSLHIPTEDSSCIRRLPQNQNMHDSRTSGNVKSVDIGVYHVSLRDGIDVKSK